jgi:glycosyltransferase involved in cell wall biosynthesis
VTNSIPVITAVICTRNRPDSIADAVKSVLANAHPSFELVVVDQSDTDASRQALGELANDPRLRYVYTDLAGLSRAYNIAVRAGRGSLFAFTDDDCTAPPDWLESVEREFQQDAEADLLYGQVIAPPELARRGIVPELRFDRRRRLSNRTGFAVIGMGANFAVRRRAFELVGGFDEVLGGGGPLRSSQDYDFQYRLFRSSSVSILSPEVNITHYGLRTAEQWPQTLSAYGIGDGAFYMKHLRCGDLLAGRLLARQIAIELRRTIANPVIRHRRHSPAYLVGMLQGMRKSFGFAVDRGHRMYVAH